MSRGLFIVIEGLDRAGKSTQCRLLAEKLAKKGPVECIRFPDRTTAIGQMINAYLQSTAELSDQAIHLLFSANRWELASSLEEKLNAGINLVCDRYVYSGIAFSAAKGLDLKWCAMPDSGLPEPDAVIFLDVSEAVAESRGGFGNERYEKRDIQRKVREIFTALRTTKWNWISADTDQADVAARIWEAVDAVAPSGPGKLNRVSF